MFRRGFRVGAFFAVFDADKGAGGGGGTGNDPGKKSDGQDPNSKEDPSKQKQEDKKDDVKPDPKDEKKFSQAELDKQISDRLEREKKKAEREKQEKDGEFEKLSTTLKSENEALTTERDTLKAQNALYSGLLETNLKTAMEGWPEEVTKLYPKNAPIEDRIQWVTDSSALAKKLTAQKPPVDGQHSKQGEAGGAKGVAAQHMSRYEAPDSILPKK